MQTQHASAKPAAWQPHDKDLEIRIAEIGRDLFTRMAAHPEPGIFSTKGAYARIMEWSMKDPDFKTQLFRFVDVLPVLDDSSDLIRHLNEYLGEKAGELNPALRAGLGAASLMPSLVASPIRSQVLAMARQFVAGENAADLLKRFRKNAEAGIATTADLLGEAVLTEAEADHFLERNIELLDAFAAELARGVPPCASDQGPGGRALPRTNLSVKISALCPDVQPMSPEASVPALKNRLRPILRKAAATGAFVNFDMESYKLKDLTLELYRSILEEEEFAKGPETGIALQAYLRDTRRDAEELIAWARRRGRRIGVRLVKGAYWDSETVLAAQRGWPSPVWSAKPESDANFEDITTLLLESSDVILPAFASHNVRSCAHVIARAQRLGLDPATIEFQALYGMADDLKHALRSMGYRVREYCATGALLPGMAYLVRRLLENTSNEGFLRRSHAGGEPPAELLRSPAELLAGKVSSPAPATAPGFANAANTDFNQADERARMRAALAKVRAGLGKHHPLLIGDKEKTCTQVLESRNPANPAELIGRVSLGSPADADAAVAAARKAAPGWARTPAAKRAEVLRRAAELMEARRLELDALTVLEAGKPWAEADAELSEAVDFCRFYAEEMLVLGSPVRTQVVPGELCHLDHVPRGVGAVVAPWNFPLAILTGLTVAPIVAGNPVIVKPSGQTPVIAAAIVNILREAGLPAGVVNYLPGNGRDTGARLCEHPGVDFIAFTGSRQVGCNLWEVTGRTAPGQTNLKTMVCEMGGKNALIVDNDADLDEAIPSILHSAFSYSGQKCSALSRLILLKGVHDRCLERLCEAAASLPVGDPTDPANFFGPVIDETAKARILGIIAEGKKTNKLAFEGKLSEAALKSGGHYIAPVIFSGVKPSDRLAREEIFGPVLSVLEARDLDEAIAMANDSDYALTAGMFSRSPSALTRARTELLVGNLYLNRGITGAMVGRHPFGGFRMSGAGTKAGGRGYLENFLFQRSISENVLRRGFIPPEE
jgi:RHH-type proline utilization regulon transcriptional repressor/proline dehydrogenase/delta 1-pyrroline-5-carboxylate dehydrogenase